MTDYIIWDGIHTPQVYVLSIDKVGVHYMSTTNINFALAQNETDANADAGWLNIHFGERFGVHAHNH